MTVQSIIIAIVALITGFIGGHVLSVEQVPSNIDDVAALIQSKDKLYEAEARRCLQLAQNAYVRDFTNLCTKDQSSPSCDTTDFNSASGYGVYQLAENPAGDFAMLYKIYQSDMKFCTE